MAALNFPTSPSVDDLYTANGSTWKWDGTSWNVVPANALLSTLEDVSLTSATAGDLIQYDGTDWVNEAGLFTNIVDNGTESTKIAVGTTAQRPASPTAGDLRFNSDLGKTEFYNGTNWETIESSVPFLATGGTVTEITEGGVDYRVHTFTSSGTFEVTSRSGEVEYLVVAGGGGGGQDRGGGGGAGGLRTSWGTTSGGGVSAESEITMPVGIYSITVGGGGAGALNASTAAGSGSDSAIAGLITSIGGGRGGGPLSALSGGSGGGAKSGSGGAGTAGQGYAGADATAGGGGGAAGVGTLSGDPREGGPGLSVDISGSSTTYAAGGRGANNANNTDPAGAANSGNGGPGGGYPGFQQAGKAGGSGVVIIRYPI